MLIREGGEEDDEDGMKGEKNDVGRSIDCWSKRGGERIGSIEAESRSKEIYVWVSISFPLHDAGRTLTAR